MRTTALLTWSHYLSLLKAPEAKRDHYLQRAVDEDLSELAAIATDVPVEAKARPKKTRDHTSKLQYYLRSVWPKRRSNCVNRNRAGA